MVSYLSFRGDEYEMTAWTGERLALLTPSDMSVDPTTIATLLSGLDEAWAYYASLTGREPQTFYNHNGLPTIAVVEKSCGAGCGFLGFTGIEIERPYFQAGQSQLADHGLFDQIPFYEIGRNFWFYGDQLGQVDAFVTGFAVVNRFLSMDAAGVDGAAIGVADFATFRHAILDEMAQLYLADSTGGIDGLTTSPPENAFNLGAADVAAALFYRIHEDFGQEGYAKFWQTMSSLPKAATPQEAVANFLEAAQTATGVDYGALFKDGWSLQVGDAGSNDVRLASGVSGPQAAFGFDGDDRMSGSRQADHLFGGDGDDDLFGERGDDVLVAALGDDRLDGGPGLDWMAGGDGADTFLFSGKNGRGEFDVIADFELGIDRIELGKGVKVKSVDQIDVNDDGLYDTVVTMKDGSGLHLLDLNHVDRGDLFLA